MRRAGWTPIVFGVLAIVVAGLWWWLSAPAPGAVRTAEVSCTMSGRSECSVPGRDTVVPIVMAVAGAFLILVGTILYAGSQAQQHSRS